MEVHVELREGFSCLIKRDSRRSSCEVWLVELKMVKWLKSSGVLQETEWVCGAECSGEVSFW